ncbi:MAG: hypothetical protein PHF00_06525 [Elusimicrobia bacterium]|nr:hypothetical protein [Elusimicrobiota bacterium]
MRLFLAVCAVLLFAPSACKRRQPPASAGPTMIEERKPADFPPETVEKPRDVEKGEGLPEEFKKTIEKRLGEKKKK